MNKTRIAVAAFIVILIAAGYAATARADTVQVGLGKSILNSSATKETGKRCKRPSRLWVMQV